ncbi:MAG TPA: hypothetical protein VFL85_04880 [Candidatus Saccharimonadales bacterium]|nr:hypothetical protein [Candidatus Saccharimonadales bacterium]
MARQIAVPRDRINNEVGSETKSQRRARAAVRPGGYLWPELRVGRQATIEGAEDWNHYINLLGRKNRRRGDAVTIGQMACNYVTDTEMRHMIMAKYEHLAGDRSEASRIYRGIRQRVAGLIADRRMEIGSFRLDPGDLDEHFELLGKTQPHHAREFGRCALYQACELKIRDISTGGVLGYDGNKFGLDLSDNDFLWQEHHDILAYLRQDEKLDTNQFARSDWSPHATIFKLSPNLAASQFAMSWPTGMPLSIDFDAPKALGQ